MKTSHCTDNKRIALFPGSFDPFTRGHESIVMRALPLFDEIIIAIGVNINKQALTSMELRKQLIESVFKNEPKVKVITYTGLTAEVARELNANFFLRGVRLIQDFENEMNMAEVNREFSGIETVLLYTLPEHSHISSSIVRELVKYKQDVTAYLPKNIDWKLVPEHWIFKNDK